MCHLFYDDDGGVPVTCEVTGDPVYCSLNGGVDEQHLVFALLNVEDIPDEAIGIPVDNPHANVATGTSPDVRTPALHTSPVFIHSYSQGIIVGHPEGCSKRISTVEFEVTDFPVLKHKYSQKGTCQGSSGSPVLINNPGISPLWSIILHYGVKMKKSINGVDYKEREFSLGVDMTWVIQDIIQQAMLRQQEKKQAYDN